MTPAELAAHIAAYFAARREMLYASELYAADPEAVEAARLDDKVDDERLAMHLAGNIGQREIAYREVLSSLESATTGLTECEIDDCWCGARPHPYYPDLPHTLRFDAVRDALRLARALLGRTEPRP